MFELTIYRSYHKGLNSDDDKCRLVDSGAFNDIIRAFLKMAVTNADIGEEAQTKVLEQLRWIFDEKQAKEIMEQI